MSVNTKPQHTATTAPMLKNTAGAPVIFFDNVPVCGAFSGNVEIELATRFLMPKPDGSVAAEMACTAHLRCSPQAATALIDTLSRALDLLSKLQTETSERTTN